MNRAFKNSPSHRDTLRLGFVPLSDAAPVVMARELGLYKKHGLSVELQREVGWATIREKIFYGELEAALAPAGMVLAASCGLGSTPVECVTGLVTSLNGNAITISDRLRKKGCTSGDTLRKQIERTGDVYTFGAVYSFSSHSFLLRQWLQANGIKPDRDVRIVVLPPKQLPVNLKAGGLDGYCVGEPWNSIAVLAKSGVCVATSSELDSGHPEKVLMVRSRFAEQYEQHHVALIAAILEACRYCQDPANRAHVVQVMARPEYVGVKEDALLMGMEGGLLAGTSREGSGDPISLYWGEGVNAPTIEKAQWVARSVAQSGHLEEQFSPTNEQLQSWFREDVFAKALQLIEKH
ncbi:MAG: CmpA/NrtA family ABC transporter substrate-binding protein [Verrucomicrobiota bacterium]